MVVRGSMRCPGCGARWSLVGEPKENEEICPNCRTLGKPAPDHDPVSFSRTPASESQELPPLPMEQQIIRLATKLYLERLKEFERSLDDRQRKSVRSPLDDVVSRVKSFARFLEQAGLPLEENVEMSAETVKPGDLRELNKHIEILLNRANAAHETFWRLFGKEMKS